MGEQANNRNSLCHPPLISVLGVTTNGFGKGLKVSGAKSQQIENRRNKRQVKAKANDAQELPVFLSCDTHVDRQHIVINQPEEDRENKDPPRSPQKLIV